MKKAGIIKLLCTPEPQFLLPGLGAIAVGTAAGAKDASSINWLYVILATAAIILINAGSNMLNDYFDHLSGNDWLNDNVTKFGGGSRYIQNGIVTPEAMRAAGVSAVLSGVLIGLIIVVLTKSAFILLLGAAGFLGGLFWTAPPIKLCYRVPGEGHIFAMFGLLPTYGAYYLQNPEINVLPLIPASVIGIHISLAALINSIPDRKADAAVNKRTFAVRFGLEKSVNLYRLMLTTAYAISLLTFFLSGNSILKYAAAGHLCTLPAAAVCFFLTNRRTMARPGVYKPNAFTIILYCLASAAMCTGIIFV